MSKLTKILTPKDPGHEQYVYRSTGGLLESPLWPRPKEKSPEDGL